MTVTTKPSPVGDDAAKQTQSPPAVNHPEALPPSVPPCTVGSADSVTSPPDASEQPSEPDVQEYVATILRMMWSCSLENIICYL